MDVVPIVPLGDTTMDDCVELANRFAGRRAALRHPGLSLCERSPRADRVRLADVRRGQYEGLREEIGFKGREPDYGPARTHPTFGALAVSARPFLIAYNINLDSDDLELAKRIARRVRESSGGLPKVQVGFLDRRARAGPGLDEPARFRRDADVAGLGHGPGARRGGRRRTGGVGTHRSRPAGRTARRGRPGRSRAADPVESRLAAAAAHLMLRDFSPLQALELRLEAARTAPR